MLRSSAEGEDRIGSLVVNPGGPGGSGVEYARAARVIVSDQIRQRYDIVGFDPRGVGESDPVECLTGPQTDQFYAVDGTPDTSAEVAEVVTVSKLFGERCERRSPTQLGYVGTREAARDLDILRAALGDQQLYYLGKSYGTFLGSSYAELFPQNVGRLVLDGVLPPDLDAEQVTLGQAKAFEVALRRFVEDCQTQDDCPLPAGVEAGIRRIREFLQELDADPLPAAAGPTAQRGSGHLRGAVLPVLPGLRLARAPGGPGGGVRGGRQRPDGHAGRAHRAAPGRAVRHQRQRRVLRDLLRGPHRHRGGPAGRGPGRRLGGRGSHLRSLPLPGAICRAAAGPYRPPTSRT